MNGHSSPSSGRVRLARARTLVATGDPGGALDLITQVLHEHSGPSGGPNSGPSGRSADDDELVALASATLGKVLQGMGAASLAVGYFEAAVDGLADADPDNRIDAMACLIRAAINSDQIDKAKRTLVELEVVLGQHPDGHGDGRADLLARSRAAVQLATGDPEGALATLDEVPVGSTQRAAGVDAMMTRLRALNRMGRHREVIDLAGPDPDGLPDAVGQVGEVGEAVVVELARAHEALGELRQAYRYRRLAWGLQSERTVGMTALLPVVDELDISEVLTGASAELSQRSDEQQRADERFNRLTPSLLGDLQAKVNALDAVVRRVGPEPTEAGLEAVRRRTRELTEATSMLDQRPASRPGASEVRTEHVLERLCRTMEPSAANRGIRIERQVLTTGSEPGGWQYYSTWRHQVAEAVHMAGTGSVVRVTADGPELRIEVG